MRKIACQLGASFEGFGGNETDIISLQYLSYWIEPVLLTDNRQNELGSYPYGRNQRKKYVK